MYIYIHFYKGMKMFCKMGGEEIFVYKKFLRVTRYFQSWNETIFLQSVKKKKKTEIASGRTLDRNMNYFNYEDNDRTRNAILAFYFESRASRAERNACAF